MDESRPVPRWLDPRPLSRVGYYHKQTDGRSALQADISTAQSDGREYCSTGNGSLYTQISEGDFNTIPNVRTKSATTKIATRFHKKTANDPESEITHLIRTWWIISLNYQITPCQLETIIITISISAMVEEQKQFSLCFSCHLGL